MNKITTAKDIASNNIFFIDGLASVKEAVDLMKLNQVDTLFISKRNDQDANGILMVSDIVKGVILKNLNLSEVNVYEIMNKPAISIPASLNAKYVPRFLVNAHIKVAPVEENGVYIGIISMSDIVFNAL